MLLLLNEPDRDDAKLIALRAARSADGRLTNRNPIIFN